MKLLAVLLITLSLGCDPVVKTEAAGDFTFKIVTTGCYTTGFCFSCMPGFDGKMSCGYKFSSFCSGSRKEEIKERPVINTRKSGKQFYDTQTVYIGYISECE